MTPNDPEKAATPSRKPSSPTEHTVPADNLDATISYVLSQAPEVSVPADFASRVTRQITSSPAPRALRWLGWGPRLALGSAVLLTFALFAIAPHAAPTLTSLPFDAELVLFTELSALLLFAPQWLRRD